MPKGIKGFQEKEINPSWKGEHIGYWGVHDWISEQSGRPRICVECGTTTAKKYCWANVSGKYLRDTDDFKRLCCKCHLAFDKQIGEGHPMAKLKENMVFDIRKLYSVGDWTLKELGKKFGVDKSTVGRIINRQTWSHI